MQITDDGLSEAFDDGLLLAPHTDGRAACGREEGTSGVAGVQVWDSKGKQTRTSREV